MKNSEIQPAHANHPGWTAQDCQHRIVVTPAYGSTSAAGFACGLSGGHCLPCTACKSNFVPPNK